MDGKMKERRNVHAVPVRIMPKQRTFIGTSRLHVRRSIRLSSTKTSGKSSRSLRVMKRLTMFLRM